MGKNFTPFDKAIKETDAFKYISDLFAEDEEDKKKTSAKLDQLVKQEEDKNKILPENKFKDEMDSLQGITYFELPNGRLATNSSDPEDKKKIEELNTDSDIMSRVIARQEREEPVETQQSAGDLGDAILDLDVEKMLLGPSPLDTDKTVSTPERLIRKTAKEVGEMSKAGVTAVVKTGTLFPQLAQGVNKYILGTGEQLIRGAGGLLGFGEGMVDYDKLSMANTGSKNISEAAEKFEKSAVIALGANDLNITNKVLMYVTEFAIPLNAPKKLAKFYEIAGDVATDIRKSIKSYDKEGNLIESGFMTTPRSLPSLTELREIKELKNAPDAKKYAEINERILNDRAKLLNEGLENINSFDKGVGKGLQALKRAISGEKTRKSGMAASYQTIGGKTRLVSTPIIENIDTTVKGYEQRALQETIGKLMHGQSVISAGAIAGTWDSYFEGTEYQDLSYLMALTSVVANPTTTMKLLDVTMNAVFAGKLGLQNFKVPFVSFKQRNELGSEIDVPLTLPSLLDGMGRAVSNITAKEGKQINYMESTYAKRVRAMAMGVPFYKLFDVDSTTKRKELNGLTDLEALTTFSKKEFKALEKFSDDVLKFLPKEYLDSYSLMVKKGTDLISKIQNSKYGDKTAEFNIALEQMVAGIRLNAFSGILNEAHKTKGVDLGSAGNILNLFRTQQQELQDQVGYIKSAMEQIVGGLGKTDKDFMELKIGADKIMAKLQSNVNNFKSSIEILSKESNSISGLQRSLDVRKLKNDPKDPDNSFNHSEKFGNSDTRKEFGEGVFERVEGAYKQAEEVKTAKFDKLEARLEGTELNADDYVRGLEKLKNEDIQNFGSIENILKNPSKYRAFGRFSPKQETISYKNDIDQFIAFTRYRGLQDLNEESLLGKIDDIIDNYPTGLTLRTNNEFPHSKNNGSFDLASTRANYEEHAENIGMAKEDYLRVLLSNMQNNREPDFLDLFTHKANASDMHTIRKNHTSWSWKNKGTPASTSVYNLTKNLDETFEKHNIPELAEANKQYTEFKQDWHESFIGKKLLREIEELDTSSTIDVSNTEDLLIPFIKAKNSKMSKELLNKLFGKYTDENNNIINRTDLEAKIAQDLDDTFMDQVVSNNLLSGKSTENSLKKIQDLRANNLISEKNFKLAEKYIDLHRDISKYSVDASLEKAKRNIDSSLKRVTDDQMNTIKKSIGAEVEKIKDSDSLIEFLIPRSGASTYAREAVSVTGESRALQKELEEVAEKNIEYIRQFGVKSDITLQDITKSFEDTFETKNLEMITGNRFDVFMKEVYGIPKGSRIDDLDNLSDSKKNSLKTQVKDLRDIIVSTIIRRSTEIESTRKANLDLVKQERTPSMKLADNLSKNLLNEGALKGPSGFELNTDFNIAELGSNYKNIEQQLKQLDNMLGSNRDTFTEDLQIFFDALVAVKGKVPDTLADSDLSSVPKGLTYAAALSRVYSGMRGVVSWRYLATEQIIREQQRAKHLMFHKILSDPDFVNDLSLIVNKKDLQSNRTFVKKIKDIMLGPSFARAVVYDPDSEDQTKYDPTDNEIVNYLRSFFDLRDIQEDGIPVPFTDMAIPVPLLNEPKATTEGDLEFSVLSESPLESIEGLPFGGVRTTKAPSVFDSIDFNSIDDIEEGKIKSKGVFDDIQF